MKDNKKLREKEEKGEKNDQLKKNWEKLVEERENRKGEKQWMKERVKQWKKGEAEEGKKGWKEKRRKIRNGRTEKKKEREKWM